MKVKKRKGVYSTVSDLGGLDFRTIAEKMTAAGFRMNHSNARSILQGVLMRFAGALSNEPDDDKIKRLASNPNFQEGLGALLQDLIKSNK